MMRCLLLGVVIGLLVASASAIIVTPFTGCVSPCTITQVYYPSATSMIIQTAEGNVYRSVDEGQTWTQLNLYSATTYSFPNNSLAMIFVNGTNFYTTSDGGNTITARQFPGNPYQIELHPTNSSWILICYLAGSSQCTVSYTKDFGATWTLATGLNKLILPNYLQWAVSPQQPDAIFGLDSSRNFGYSLDYATWHILLPNAVGFVVTDNFLFVGVTSAPGITLYSSSNRNDPTHTSVTKYVPAEFPFGDKLPSTERGYTFLDDITRSEYIAVSVATVNYYGSVFNSEFDGVSYSYVLPFVAQTSMLYDFDRVNGLPGIYIVNAYPSAIVYTKQTLITYDNGGEWHLLPAPTNDKSGKPLNCQIANNCSLHMHGLTSWYFGVTPPYYSSPNAIGLIVGVGNIGAGVSTKAADQSTWFSRDAGLTWTQLYNGPTIYEFGDHGGILVFASIAAPTSTIYYSTDEGLSTTPFVFSGTDVWVDNIIIEPSGTGRKFVLMATDATVSNKHYIIGLDFSDSNLPNCNDNDYELWAPSDGEHGKQVCLLGSTNIYKRRRQTAQCYNNRDTDHVVDSKPCACTFLDYECDTAFAPSARNTTDGFVCYAIDDNPDCLPGYRMIPDTQCQGGLNLNCTNCCAVKGGGGGGGNTGVVVGVVLLVLFLVGGASAVGVLYWKNDKFRQWVLNKLGKGDVTYSKLNVNEEDDEGEI